MKMFRSHALKCVESLATVVVPCPPHRFGAGREGGVRDLHPGGLEADGGQVAAGGVAELFLTVPVLARRDRADPGVRAVRVGDQEQAFQELRLVDRLAGAHGGEGLEHPGAQGGFLEDVDEGDGAPLLADRLLELARVLGLLLRLGVGELDRPIAVLAADGDPRQHGSLVSRAPSSARISAFSWAVKSLPSRGLFSFS
ncbi:hypothetical protein GCM10010376_92710 [Streptomyces violaceusniger]